MATKPRNVAGRYADLTQIPVGQDVRNQLFGTIKPLSSNGQGGQWWMEQMTGESGQQLATERATPEALDQLKGYTYDWNPSGTRNEGWLTAYKPDGTQAGRFWQTDTSTKQSALEAAALAAAGFGGVGLLTGLGPLGGLQAAMFGQGAGGGLMGPPIEAAGGLMGPPIEAAGAGLGSASPFSYAPVGAENSFSFMNAGAAPQAGGFSGGLASSVTPAELTAGLGEYAASGLPASVMNPTIPGLGAVGSAAPAVFNAAADSQAASAALGLGPNAGSVPSAVNLGSAGGLQSTGGGWGIFDPIAGAVSGAKDAVAGVVGDKGADLLWNLGKGAIGTAIAGKAADALAPKVDTGAITAQATAASDIAKRQMDLAEKQYADQQALLGQYSPMLQELIRGQITDQGLSRDRSNAQWADYTNTWRPVEQQFANQAMSWGNQDRYRAEANRAGADAATQFDRAKQSQVRQLQMAGASPEKIAALTASGDILAAKGIAGNRSQAYRDAEMKGLNVLQGAASFGRNMPSTGIQAASLAGQQGQQGMAGVQGLSNLTATPASIASGLMGQSLNANNMATQSLLQAQNMGLQANNQRNAIFGDILGAGLGAIGMSGGFGNFFSSKKMKNVGAKVDGKDAEVMVTDSPSRAWSYKPGLGDGSTKPRMGPTAEDLRDATGGVVSDGRTVDGIGMLGLHHAAIGSLSKRLDRIESQKAGN